MERIATIFAGSLLAGLLLEAGAPAAATAAGYRARVSWAAPTVNADGSKLSDLIGFNVYRGTSPTSMMLAASVTAGTNSYAESNLTPSVWYWYITAVNSQGAESAPSPTVSKVIVADVPGAGASPGGTTAGGITPGSGTASGGTGGGTVGGPYSAAAGSVNRRQSLCMPKGDVWCSR